MPEKNWMRNPEFHDSDYNASTPEANIPDGCNYSHWVGTPKSTVRLERSSGSPAAPWFGNAWYTDYTFLTGEAGNNFINIGGTGAGSWVKTTIDSITSGTPSTIHTTSAHGLEVGDAVYLSGVTAEGGYYVTQVDSSQQFKIAENVSLTGAGRCSPCLYARVYVMWWSSDPAVTCKLSLYQRNASDGTVGSSVGSANIPQNWSSGAAFYSVGSGSFVLDDACDHLQFDLVLGNCVNVGSVVKVWLAYPNIVKRKGTRDWISGNYGGTWEGTAHNSATDQNTATIISSDHSTAAPLDVVTFTGTDLGMDLLAGITIGGTAVPASDIIDWDEDFVSFRIPQGTTSGVKAVSVEPGVGGGADPTDQNITIVGTTITSVTPETDYYPGSRVTIVGTNLGTSGTITVGGLPVNTIVSWTPTQVVFRLPRLHPGARALVFTASGGSTVNYGNITIIAAPFLTRYNGADIPYAILKVKSGSNWVEPTAMSVYDGLEWWEVAFGKDAVVPPPPPTEDFVWPTGNTITVSTKTVSAIQNAIDTQAKPGDTILLQPGTYTDGATATPTLTLPDHVNLKGAGIWKQTDLSSGGGGTWVKARFIWGSRCHIHGLLIGFNIAGKACNHKPLSRETSRTDCADTKNLGCTHPVFTNVRFKGGSDSGDGWGSLIQLGDNYKRGWVSKADGMGTIDMIDHRWYDCEFERPQGANGVRADGVFKQGDPGSWFSGWWDCREGGSYVKGNRWVRCHMGVKNSRNTGIDQYGIGTTTLLQPSPTGPTTYTGYAVTWAGYLCNASDLPSTQAITPGTKERWLHPDCGPSTDGGSSISLYYPYVSTSDPYGGYGYQPAGSPKVAHTGNWNPNFNWNLFHHGADDNQFIDCLFEYATWHPFNPCDWARNYSTWQGCLLKDYSGNTFWDANGNPYAPPGQTGGSGGAAGWGNPPGKNWTQIPVNCWNRNFSMTRCYEKGCINGGSAIVGEISRDCIIDGCYNMVHNQSTRTFTYGNVVKNAVSSAYMAKPTMPAEATAMGVSSVFTGPFTGSDTTYTPSPWDPS